MMQILITKRTPYKNCGLGSDGQFVTGSIGHHPEFPYYDEQMDHEIVEVNTASTQGGCPLWLALVRLGYGFTPEHEKEFLGKKFFLKCTPGSKSYYTYSEWTGSHELGMLWPGKINFGQGDALYGA